MKCYISCLSCKIRVFVAVIVTIYVLWEIIMLFIPSLMYTFRKHKISFKISFEFQWLFNHINRTLKWNRNFRSKRSHDEIFARKFSPTMKESLRWIKNWLFHVIIHYYWEESNSFNGSFQRSMENEHISPDEPAVEYRSILYKYSSRQVFHKTSLAIYFILSVLSIPTLWPLNKVAGSRV